MKIGPFSFTWGQKQTTGLTIDQVMSRIETALMTTAGVAVTPENCMQSPTVNAIVTAISRRISTLPVLVMRKMQSGGRATKEALPNHPVAKLLARPNDWQDPNEFWLDATSQLVRHGNFFCMKSRGTTGPIRFLLPVRADAMQVRQETDWSVVYEGSTPDGSYVRLSPDQILHARDTARDFLRGDSKVIDIRDAIALEIAAERMGASVFGNSALPSMVFQFEDAFAGFKTEEERAKFTEDFQTVYAKKGRFSAMLLPKGIKIGQSATVENEKAQFIQTRAYQRTVIAAAFGVPVHMVGDLTKGTFNNVEQQTLDFVLQVVLPYARCFENAMERSLLTDEDRRSGVIIRFNLDGVLRGTFTDRQTGLQIQRQNGVISANDWREQENMNPLPEADGGNEYWRQGASGQSANAPGGDTPPTPEPATEGNEGNEPQPSQP
jgi:HK97 family phage portal protein